MVGYWFQAYPGKYLRPRIVSNTVIEGSADRFVPGGVRYSLRRRVRVWFVFIEVLRTLDDRIELFFGDRLEIGHASADNLIPWRRVGVHKWAPGIQGNDFTAFVGFGQCKFFQVMVILKPHMVTGVTGALNIQLRQYIRGLVGDDVKPLVIQILILRVFDVKVKTMHMAARVDHQRIVFWQQAQRFVFRPKSV